MRRIRKGLLELINIFKLIFQKHFHRGRIGRVAQVGLEGARQASRPANGAPNQSRQASRASCWRR